MSRPALSPTITHQVRAFLSSQGAAVPPWSGLRETYDGLFTLLRQRRDDAAFWPALRELIHDIVHAAAEPGRLPAPDAELLNAWDIEQVVQELRDALPRDAPTTGWKQLLTLRSAPVVGAFLLLGWVAAGCGGEVQESRSVALAKDASADGTIDASPEASIDGSKDASWSQGCALDPKSVLFESLAESELGDHQKTTLCQCLAGLNASWEQGLTELFATATPEELAKELKTLYACCHYSPQQLDSDFEKVRDDFLNGAFCLLPPYRGVALPPG